MDAPCAPQRMRTAAFTVIYPGSVRFLCTELILCSHPGNDYNAFHLATSHLEVHSRLAAQACQPAPPHLQPLQRTTYALASKPAIENRPESGQHALTACHTCGVNAFSGILIRFSLSETKRKAIQQIKGILQSRSSPLKRCSKAFQIHLRNLHRETTDPLKGGKRLGANTSESPDIGPAKQHLRRARCTPACYWQSLPAYPPTFVSASTSKTSSAPTCASQPLTTYAFTPIYTHLQAISASTYTLTPPLKGVSVTVAAGGLRQ